LGTKLTGHSRLNPTYLVGGISDHKQFTKLNLLVISKLGNNLNLD